MLIRSEYSPSKKTITTMKNIKLMSLKKGRSNVRSKKSLDKWKGKFALNDPEPLDKFQFIKTRENSMDKTIREANFRAT
jgi:hypothetical protein